MHILKYKYRLYPTHEQLTKLAQITGSVRYIWNYFLDRELKEYASSKKFIFFNQNSQDLTALKQTTQWLNDVPSTSLQQTLRYLNTTLKQSFGGKKGFPKFKSKKNFNASFTLAMVNSKQNVRNNAFYISKVGDVKCVYHRDLPSDFKTCQVTREGDRWFVVLTCNKETQVLPKTNKTTGIDLNSKEYVLSNNTRYEIPKYLKENQFRIKELQRSVSRKVKGGSNRRKAQLKLHKVHQRITNKRLDYFNKLSMQLVRDYDVITLEDLDVKSIQKKMGRVTQDNGFSIFRAMILYKAKLYGKETVIIDRYYPSSQLCSGCGTVQKMPLSFRTYECKCCGLVMDRDLNAACNIHRAGTALSAFGDNRLVDESVVIGKLIGVNEEGSYAL
jgi:putative transposase